MRVELYGKVIPRIMVLTEPPYLELVLRDINLEDGLKRLQSLNPEEIILLTEKSGLRGRGGGGFHLHLKWQLALKKKPPRILIANGCEGEKGAYSNFFLLRRAPRRIVMGLAASIKTLGVSEVYFTLRPEYLSEGDRLKPYFRLVEDALNVRIHLFFTQGRYVEGEETALISLIEKKVFAGFPLDKPPHPVEKGLFGYPTVVSNVETLGQLSLVLLNGYSRGGSQDYNQRTKVITVTTSQGTYAGEAPLGVKVEDLLSFLSADYTGVHIGGLGGIILKGGEELKVSYSFEGLRNFGTSLGASLVVLEEPFSPSQYLVSFLDSALTESCGKCVPCRSGLSLLFRNPYLPEYIREEILYLMTKASLCGLGKGASIFLRKFYKDFGGNLGSKW